jgi:membrane protein YqaA with SNARE-associated domain
VSNYTLPVRDNTEPVIVTVIKSPARLLRKLYDWTINWSKTKRAPYALFGIAFAESSFFPVPPDTLLIPMTVGNRQRWFVFAAICTVGSVTGAFLGYLIGWALWESVGQPIVDFYHLEASMELVRERYAENAFLAILTAAFTPIPFKVFTIAAGLFKISPIVLLLAASIGRASRFFLVAGLLRVFGRKISDSIEKYFDILSLLFLGLLIGGFLAIKYLR